MNVEEGYYYFVSGKDRGLDQFRKIQPLQPLNFWKDIYYYPFQKCENFWRLLDLFDKNKEYKLEIQQIEDSIIKTAEIVYQKTKIIPNMKLRYIFIQCDVQESQSQLSKKYEQQFIIVFVKASKLKSFEETKNIFKRKFDELICCYSQHQYIQKYKMQKNQGFMLGNYCFKIMEKFKQVQKSEKQQQTYLIRNIQDYIKCQSNQIDIDRISTYMETINNQYIQWINFDLDFFKINDIKKIMQQPDSITALQQLQQYCIVVNAINQNFNIYGEIVLYVTQVKSYLNLQDEILDIEDFAFQLMNSIIVPQLRTEKSLQSLIQIFQQKKYLINEQILNYIKQKVNKL